VAVPVADTAQNATPAQAHHGTAAPSASNPEKGSAGNAASKAALGQPATHESGISVAGAPASGIAAPPVVASPESPRRYVFDNPTATPSTGGKPAVEPDTASRSMVQIMTLANKDDAESMAAALKRHGYNVAVNHDPQDSLLHLEVGPFASKTDAEAMRQRLLSDGYNASVR
jgi:cell division septation protein DedD